MVAVQFVPLRTAPELSQTQALAPFPLRFGFFVLMSAAIFNDLFLINGNGLDASTAIGVKTGYTFSIKKCLQMRLPHRSSAQMKLTR